ncbi:MAG: hypothetical protein MJY83_04960 [Bacteroidales bacterium]|nr:hypothetical protein [Bacteroidales bacterium]
MENKIFTGERLTVVGELSKAVTTIENGTASTSPASATTAESVSIQIIQFGRILQEVEMEVTGSKYVGSFSTDGITGDIIVRFVVKDAGGKVVSNEDIPLTIHW